MCDSDVDGGGETQWQHFGGKESVAEILAGDFVANSETKFWREDCWSGQRRGCRRIDHDHDVMYDHDHGT